MIGKIELLRLTAGKAVANTSLRWIPFFLPTLAVAFDSSTATLALLLGIAEACGLSTLVAGRWLDSGKERAAMITALLVIAVASVVALAGSVVAFGVMAMLLGGGAGYVTVSGHAWISARVPFERRARFIGIYEMSWASALLIGVPIVALLISQFNWRAPFIFAAVASLLVAFGVSTVDDGDPLAVARAKSASATKIGRDVWVVIGAAAMTAVFGLTVIVIAGTWLDEQLGVSTGGIGLVAMAFGAAELLASSVSSAFADAIGKRRSMMFSVLCALAGMAVIFQAGSSLLVGATGMLVFFLGFEYSIVTSFSLVSEAMPEARGRALGLGNAVGTVGRGAGVAAAGFLYEAFGIRGPIALSAFAAVATLGFLVAIGRLRPDLR